MEELVKFSKFKYPNSTTVLFDEERENDCDALDSISRMDSKCGLIAVLELDLFHCCVDDAVS